LLELVDTHCHLNFEAFVDDLELVIQRARQADIKRIINPAIDIQSSQEITALAGALEPVFSAVGVHPNSAGTWQHDTQKHLTNLCAMPKNVAVGEIGLDYYWDAAPRTVQQKIFKQQLELAGELNLPVIIHNRDATQDVLRILSEYVTQLKEIGSPLQHRPGVLHSFSATIDDALSAISMNFFIGITGPVTFKKAESLRNLVAEIPPESLLLETDAPFLTPHPHRGKRNEPAYVRYIAEKIGEITGRTLIEVGEITTKNAEKLFGWSVMD
jgi:TatD DNase family protein